MGETYLDAEFAPKVAKFLQYAREGGVPLQFTSAYRTQATQDALPPTATTPAEFSLHSAGLAVDVSYDSLKPRQQQVVRDAAARAGLGWGGNFRTPDRKHFYLQLSGDRRRLIDNFTVQIQNLRGRK